MNASGDSFPWLEAVEDENEAPRLSAGKMLAAIAVVLLAAALVAGTLFWLGRQGSSGSGAPELIRAEPGPYKVKPADPGGLDVAGESGTAYATGAGEETDAELDLSAVPEEPIARPQPPTRQAAGQPEPAAPAVPAGPPGSTVQLGAYENQALAEAGWTALSGRFPAVAGLTKLVVPYAVNGSTGYRLRAAAASPAEAQRTCQLLKVAGENCFVVR
ncbi:MAG: SPOR domain-containing protein [uncultured Sphingomonas sp.]|uniref:SPOR domain-containing protein n=1 Tax=uncultured Sphingomonas sp. TaxID=158754 RepID=A0A6J4SUT1_9SPHN|nr:SPOR domain-containing protein [uncultured Sphingomonas sp.]CAA9505743.1 MAG: SPOR domain-containing protein [uncultured Sphingomonas sp.]